MVAGPPSTDVSRASAIARGLVPFLFAAFAGCATGESTERRETSVESTDAPPPGTERWSGAALRLPEGAPITVELHLDRLLSAGRTFRDWVVDEPEMFGERGEQLVATWRSFWRRLEERTGSDPFTAEAVERLGVDTERGVYMGLFPASAGGSGAFVEAVESTLRRRLESDGSRDLLKQLEEMVSGDRPIPEGLHREVSQQVASLDTWTGMRVLIPVSDADRFFERLSRFAGLAGYRAVESETDSERPPEKGVWVDPRSRWEAFSARPISREEGTAQWVALDILFRQWSTRTSSLSGASENRADAARRALTSLTEAVDAGRPSAPRRTRRSAIAASMDQRGTSAYARLQGYLRVLDRARRAAAPERDETFVAGLSDAIRLGRNWELASERLSGVSYAFTAADGSSDEIVQFRMTLFGPEARDLPAPRGAPVGLGVGDRTFGASVGLAPIFGDEWGEWLDIESPERVADYMPASDFGPALFGLSLPRTLALLSVNVDRIAADDLSKPLEPLYDHRQHFRRLELGTSGLGPDSLANDPRFAAVLALDPETPPDVQREVFRGLAPSLRLIARTAEDAPESDGTAEGDGSASAQDDIATDEWIELRSGGGPGRPLRYFAHPSSSEPYAFVSYGLSASDARRELDRARDEDRPARTESVFYARIELPTLLTAIGAYRAEALSPLDPGVLAQRLGPLEAQIRPVSLSDAQAVQYQFSLLSPPDL